MKTSTIHELKQELSSIPHSELLDICLRLARFKKENKELLTYLLFEAHNLPEYIDSVKFIIDEGFNELPKSTPYHTKKSIRKVLRLTAKYIRYTGSSQTETELLLYFCLVLQKSGLLITKNKSLQSLYQHQLKKIRNSIAALHEDLQYDYLKQLDLLQ